MANKHAEFLTAIRQQLRRCHGFEGDEIVEARKKALDYYFQRQRGDETAGRSHVVSGDVSAMVEANIAAMMDAFGSDHIAEFDATSPEDEDQAQLESDTVQYFVMGKSNGRLQLRQAIKDALLLRNGVIKVSVVEKTNTQSVVIGNLSADGYAALEPGLVKNYDPAKKTGTIKRATTTRELKCEAVPLENFVYYADWHSQDLQEIPIVAERHVSTRSELVQLFPKKKDFISNLPKHSVDSNIAGNARNPKSHSTYNLGVDESQDPIEWFEVYVLADRDGDGIGERRKVCLTMTGKTYLADEPVNLVPYAAGTAIINPHRFLGISLFDKLKQVQDINTGLHRALMDSVNTTNKNRTAGIEGWVNDDDLSNGRPNGHIRVKPVAGSVSNAIMSFNVPDTSANILANIEHQNRMRSELGGAALDMQSAGMQLNDRMGSQGLDRMYSVAEQLAGDFTETIGSTLIRSVFLIAHEQLREHFEEPLQIKVNGRWTKANPAEWPKRECVTIKPGMSAGERQRRANALTTIINLQIQLSEKGLDGILINIDGFYRTLMDWARVSDIQNPEQYFIDPTTAESQQAMQQKQQQAAKDVEMKRALMDQAIGLEQLRVAVEKYKNDSDLQFKYYDAVLKAEVEEAKIAGQATVTLLQAKKQGIEAQGQVSNDDPGTGAEAA